jgi:hypothetical protein
VLSTAFGVFTLADALAHHDQLLNDLDFDPRYSQLVDFTHTTKVELSAEDVRKLAETPGVLALFPPGDPGWWRSAIWPG